MKKNIDSDSVKISETIEVPLNGLGSIL